MSIRRLARKIVKTAVPMAAKLTPAGRIASIGSSFIGAAKRVVGAGLASTPLMSAVQRAVGIRRRKKRHRISEKEMLELLKLQMFVSKKSIPYQIAVMKAINGKLK